VSYLCVCLLFPTVLSYDIVVGFSTFFIIVLYNCMPVTAALTCELSLGQKATSLSFATYRGSSIMLQILKRFIYKLYFISWCRDLPAYRLVISCSIVAYVIRQNRFLSASDSAYSYAFLRSVVCLSVVCHIRAPRLNCWMDLDAIWEVHLWGPVTHCE